MGIIQKLRRIQILTIGRLSNDYVFRTGNTFSRLSAQIRMVTADTDRSLTIKPYEYAINRVASDPRAKKPSRGFFFILSTARNVFILKLCYFFSHESTYSYMVIKMLRRFHVVPIG